MLLEKTEENLPFYCRTGKKKKKAKDSNTTFKLKINSRGYSKEFRKVAIKGRSDTVIPSSESKAEP